MVSAFYTFRSFVVGRVVLFPTRPLLTETVLGLSYVSMLVSSRGMEAGASCASVARPSLEVLGWQSVDRFEAPGRGSFSRGNGSAAADVDSSFPSSSESKSNTT